MNYFVILSCVLLRDHAGMHYFLFWSLTFSLTGIFFLGGGMFGIVGHGDIMLLLALLALLRPSITVMAGGKARCGRVVTSTLLHRMLQLHPDPEPGVSGSHAGGQAATLPVSIPPTTRAPRDPDGPPGHLPRPGPSSQRAARAGTWARRRQQRAQQQEFQQTSWARE